MPLIINPYALGLGLVQPTWNPLDKDADLATSGGDLIATATSTGSIRSLTSISAGKRYIEALAQSGGGSNNWRYGIATSAHTITLAPGNSATSWALRGSDGSKITNSSVTAYGSNPSDVGNTVMAALDMDNGKVWWGLNGTWFNSGDPAAGTGEAFSGLSGAMFLVFGSATGTRVIELVALASYSYPAPTGFTKGF